MTLNDNLVAGWHLDESSGNAEDVLGTHTLTNENSVTYTAGLINNCADLGASNTNKRLYRANSLGYLKTSSWSQAGWVKLKNENTGLWNIFDSRNGTDYHLQYIRYDYPGSVHTLVCGRGSNGVGATETTYAVDLGTTNWHHIVGTYDGTNLRLYLDGSLVAGPTAGGSWANGNSISDQTTLGASGNGFIYASAQFDEVYYFDVALSATEVSQLYNSGDGLAYPFSSGSAAVILQPNLLTLGVG